MVVRGSPGTMSSQTLRRLACFQKSVSKASVGAMRSSRSAVVSVVLFGYLANFVICYNQFAALYNQAAAGKAK
jgi:hypothetical protein